MTDGKRQASGQQDLSVSPGTLSLAQLRALARGPVHLEFDPACRPAIEAAAETVVRTAGGEAAVYGLNTGFGKLAQTRIPGDRLEVLQTNLVLSHCAGTGPPLDDDTVRLILALKANCLARGHSGVGIEVIDALLKLLNAKVYPVVPSKGSVGASGDLAPLAHLAATLIGHGEVRIGGQIRPAREGLEAVGLAPLRLGPKAGLALVNGTQVSTALALGGLFDAEDVFAAALVAGAMTVDAAQASDTPFDPRIQAARGHQGQTDVARVLVRLLAGSHIRQSHLECDRVQDPYSLRCQPQVMGACLDVMRFVAGTLAIEANAVSDNPLVFGENAILSGGNFHAEPVALAADTLALAIAEFGALSERRTALLVDANMSGGLPGFLVEDNGLNSGFMVAQVTAAALASENKSLAHPASVDSLPTSANQEDHVSMATFAARRLGDMADNARGIVAIELLAAAQGIEFHAPMTTSDPLAAVWHEIRSKVPFYDRDRGFAPDIEAAKALIRGPLFRSLVADLLPS